MKEKENNIVGVFRELFIEVIYEMILYLHLTGVDRIDPAILHICERSGFELQDILESVKEHAREKYEEAKREVDRKVAELKNNEDVVGIIEDLAKTRNYPRLDVG